MTKGKVVLVALGAAVAVSLAWAQPYGQGGYGMGPGMMGGGYGPGYGMGPGMMGGPGYGPGYGMGPGMMGGGYGMGPGMMGPGMMGPGMMGQGMMGMGPGMMGSYGMGPGMMGGGYGIDLSAEQRQKLFDIQRDVESKRWDLMGKLHAEGGPMAQAFAGGTFDEQAALKAYDTMAAAHKQMFETMLDARKRMDALLTPEQREQLKRNFGGRWSNR
jgi:Spy/CpxP family protein refolding chaperone